MLHIDAFDSQRSNSRGPVRLTDYHGDSGCVDLSDSGQRRHGNRVYARHRNSFTVNELRRFFGVVHVPGAGYGDECPHAPVCELIDLDPRGLGAKFLLVVALASIRNCPARKRFICKHLAGQVRMDLEPGRTRVHEDAETGKPLAEFT